MRPRSALVRAAAGDVGSQAGDQAVLEIFHTFGFLQTMAICIESESEALKRGTDGD